MIKNSHESPYQLFPIFIESSRTNILKKLILYLSVE